MGAWVVRRVGGRSGRARGGVVPCVWSSLFVVGVALLALEGFL